MRYKKDWEEAKKRHTAFWNHDIIDRCCISIQVTDSSAWALTGELWKKAGGSAEKFRTDPELQIMKNRIVMERSYYAGEAFPLAFLDLGASGHAGFFKGANYQIAPDTVWFFPALESPDDLEFDENSYLYRQTLALADALAQDSRGDYCVSMPDCTGNADALAHLIGSEEMMVSMLTDPAATHRALDNVQEAYADIMTKVYEKVRKVNDGGSCIGWLRTWAPGFHAQMQCDMSMMISSPMFKEYIKPELEAQCKLLDYPLYHFDGIEQIRHLDDLLSIPNLRTIQWTQVVGQPSCLEYIPELQKIQAAGKNLLIHAEPDQVRPLLENLSSRGLFLITSAPSREDADAIIKEAERLARD